MSANVLNLEYPTKIVGADGTAVWQGCGFVNHMIVAINGEASTAFAASEAAAWDMTNLIMQPNAWATTSAPVKQVLKVKRATTTGNQDCFAGVAINPAAAGAMVRIAGNGSVVPVKNDQNGTAQNNLIGSATAGTCTDQANLATGPNGTLGKIIKIRGTTGGTTDSGSATEVIAAISIS